MSFTLCIATKDRSEFLRRLLGYYAQMEFPYPILIGDSSGPFHADRNKKTIESLQRRLDIVFVDCPTLSSGACCERLGELVSTPYCAVVGDDDFLCTHGIHSCIQFLECHADYAAAHGKGLIVGVDNGAVYGRIHSVGPYSMAVLEEASASHRLLEFFTLSHYNLSYPVYRTRIWRTMFRGLTSLEGILNRNIFKDELIPSCIAAISGRIKELEVLYLVRQAHPAIYRHPDPFDWLTDSIWFPSYQFFLKRLKEELGLQGGLTGEQAHAVIKAVLWPYLANALCSSLKKRDSRGKRGRLRSRLRSLKGRIQALLWTHRWWDADFMPIARAIAQPPCEVSKAAASILDRPQEVRA